MKRFTAARLAAFAAAGVLAGLPAFGIAANPGSGSSAGSGRVFFPNPAAQLQDQTLIDRKDADYAALQPAYRTVALTNLDGSGYLSGDYVNVRSSAGPLAHSTSNTFLFGRSDDRFEQVMAYYWITEAQKYVRSLGFDGVTRGAINDESQDVRIDTWGQDNSYSWDKHDVIRLGKGGVDDAEDAEVILHEYGHAIHDAQGANLVGVEAGGIGEGFGDYFAVTVSNVIAPTADEPCVAAWDATSYDPEPPYCLRRVDTDRRYPENLSPTSVHRNGLIWSRALWDIRQALGHARGDRIILEAHFAFGTLDSMPRAAAMTIATAERLYGAKVAATVRGAFAARGLA